MRVSFVELYNEELYDLLGSTEVDGERLRLYEDPTRKASGRLRANCMQISALAGLSDRAGLRRPAGALQVRGL